MSIIKDKNSFLSMIERERARAERRGHSFSIIIFDLQNSRGHARGRDALARMIRSSVRVYDAIGCFASDRISVLMPYAEYEQAQNIAEKIRTTALPEREALPYLVLTYPNQWFSASDSDSTPDMERWAAANQLLREKLGMPARPLPAWKRLMDVAGALCGIALLSPLLLLLALFIRTVSPGPVFFTQERIGFLGTAFSCYKFRTMHLGASTTAHSEHLSGLIQSDAPLQKLDAADPRIIPFGKIIRMTGLDELPQLFNVLLGDMSLIGPRPCIPYEANEFKLWQRRRFDSMPGITGLWQVNGKNRTTFNEMIRYDISYAYKKNFFLDTAILLKTVPAVIEQVTDNKKHIQGGASNERHA